MCGVITTFYGLIAALDGNSGLIYYAFIALI
jgi:hypothetical protein